ncbi:MAG: hypothetical protein ACRD0H_04475, partial [Actinomycetes bacterium]
MRDTIGDGDLEAGLTSSGAAIPPALVQGPRTGPGRDRLPPGTLQGDLRRVPAQQPAARDVDRLSSRIA